MATGQTRRFLFLSLVFQQVGCLALTKLQNLSIIGSWLMVEGNSQRLDEIEIIGGDKEEHADIMRKSFAKQAEPM